MPDRSPSRSDREQQLDALIQSYYEAAEQGAAPDHEAFITANPEHAAELREFFAAMGSVVGVVDRAADVEVTHDATPSRPHVAGIVDGKIQYFGEYELLGELGTGGMGVVYRARQTRLKKVVALKMIRSGQLAAAEEVRRFTSEAQAAASLEHVGIVPVHEVGVHDGCHFYTMDFVAGGNLTELYREGPVPAARAAKIMFELAKATHYAHEQGVVHRDLKPANVLLTVGGQPRIVDFGLAKRLWADDSQQATLTVTGQVLGTAGYMSPEQAAGRNRLVGPLADVYSLGAVLYAMLTGRAPFLGESQADTLLQVMQREPLPPHSLNPAVSRDLETICLKCLEKEPHRRYGNALLLADELQRFMDGRPVLARPLSAPVKLWRWCRRNPLVAGLASTAATLLILGVVVSSLLAIQAEKARQNAEANARRASTHAAQEQAARIKQQEFKAAAEKDRDAAQVANRRAQQKTKEALQNLYVSRLYTLTPFWQQGEWGELHRLLQKWAPAAEEPDLRGWEWRYLEDQVRQQMTSLPGQVLHAAWSPHGKYLATAGGSFAIRDAYSLVPVHPPLDQACHFVAWSNNQAHVALLTDRETQLYEMSSRKVVRTLPFPGVAATWSHDRERIAIVGLSDDKRAVAKIFKLDGILVHTLELDPQATFVWSIDWHPQDERLVVGHNSDFSVWDTARGVRVYTRPTLGNPCWTVAWSPDGNQILVGGGYVNRIWNANGSRIYQTKVKSLGHADHATAGCWRPDGQFFASAGRDYGLFIFDPVKCECFGEEQVHSSPVQRIAWHPDGRIVSCDKSGRALIYQPRIVAERLVAMDATSAPPRAIPARARQPAQVLKDNVGVSALDARFSHDGLYVAAYGSDGIVRIWSSQSHRLLSALRTVATPPHEIIGAIAWSPDDRELAVHDSKGKIFVYDWASQQSRWTGVRPVTPATGGASLEDEPAISWSPDGRWIVTGGRQCEMIIWNSESGQEHARLSAGTTVGGGFSPDGRFLVRALNRESPSVLEILEFATRKPQCIEVGPAIRQAVWHPHSQQMAVATESGVLFVNTAGQKLGDLPGGVANVCSMAWSPDARRLATGNTVGKIVIWDAATLDNLFTLQTGASAESAGPTQTRTEVLLASWVLTLDWSSDSQQLLSSGKQVQIWGGVPALSNANPAAEPAHVPLAVAQQRIAELVLRSGGEIEVSGQRITAVESLPADCLIGGIALTQPPHGYLLDQLQHLTAPWWLDVRDTTFATSHVEACAGLRSLRELRAAGSALDDSSLQSLGELKHLKVLDVSDTAISEAGVDQLRALLPDAQIRRDARELDRSVAEALLAKNVTVTILVGRQRRKVQPGSVLPKSPFRIVALAAEQKPGLTATDLEPAGRLDSLESVEFLHTRINDEALSHFASCVRLRYIGCGNTAVTGKSLVGFQTLPRLERIIFGGSFQNEHVVQLKKFPRLNNIFLSYTALNDAGLAQLPDLPLLETLVIDHTQIQGESLATLRRFPKMRDLRMGHTKLTDKGLRELPVFANLRSLQLTHNSLTDESIPHLLKFTSLTKMELGETKLSAAGYAELRRKLTGCTIVGVAVESRD